MKKVLIVLSLFLAVTFAYFAGRHSAPAGDAAQARRVLYYVDPMHPSYKSDKPGIAPDCGMQLEPVYAEQESPGVAAEGPSPSAGMKISLEQQQLIGIRSVEASKIPGSYQLTAPGRVAVDDTRTYRLTSGVEGVVLATFDHSVGSVVHKNEVLASLSSPEFLAAESTFLVNWTRLPESKYEYGSPKEWKDQTLMLAVSRLRALGMSDEQLKELSKTQKITDVIEIASPVDGVLIVRNISAGQRVDKGAEFYRIADLSRVWILASLHEGEADGLRPGTEVTLSVPDQGRKWTARVSPGVPQFDPVTRTLQVRLEANNPDLVLRPDMFVNVDLQLPSPKGLTIPNEALLDAGMKKVVYVDAGNGVFEPRPVQTGVRVGGRTEIVKGLMPGEHVVVSGTFLLDSESRLRFPQSSALSGVAQMASVNTAALPKSAKDLSCGMDVSPADSVKSGNVATYEGKTYYFCSKSCRDKFLKDPKALIKGTSAPIDRGDSAPSRVPVALVSAPDLPKSATDPVCGMDIDPVESVKAGYTETFQGKTYYFCSKGCHEKFVKNPNAFISPTGSHHLAKLVSRGAQGAPHD